MFRTLDPSNEGRKRSGIAFLCGALTETFVLVAVSILGLLFPYELPETTRRYAVTWLQSVAPPERPTLHPPPKVAHVVVAIPKPAETKTPRAEALSIPTVQPKISRAPVHVLEAPLPAAPTPQPGQPARSQLAVREGLFGGAAEPVTTKRPAQEVQTGGFGSPEGLPGRAQGGSQGNVARLGSFGLPEGPGFGNGTGGSRGIKGVVANVGFGTGIAGPGSERTGKGGSGVAIGGFEKPTPAKPAQMEQVRAIAPADFQPVEIVSKPAPVYTAEAVQLRIEGEVTLSVVFEASGLIRVLGVVKSLGHGLDQAAEQAAAQIRFKPARRDGKPADFPATLHIQFRLADQSS